MPLHSCCKKFKHELLVFEHSLAVQITSLVTESHAHCWAVYPALLIMLGLLCGTRYALSLRMFLMQSIQSELCLAVRCHWQGPPGEPWRPRLAPMEPELLHQRPFCAISRPDQVEPRCWLLVTALCSFCGCGVVSSCHLAAWTLQLGISMRSCRAASLAAACRSLLIVSLHMYQYDSFDVLRQTG